jgi:hypothetical protein
MNQQMKTWIKQARVAALFRGLRLAQSCVESPAASHVSTSKVQHQAACKAIDPCRVRACVVWTNFIQAKLHLSTSSSSPSSRSTLTLRHRDYIKSSRASTTVLASTHPWLLLIDRAGSSSPTSFVVIIADNHLHHQHRNIIATVTAHGQRQTPTRSSPSPTSDAAQLQAENPVLIPDMFYNNKSSLTTTTSSSSTMTLPLESQSIFICTSVHKFSPCSYFVYSDTADNFFAPTVYGDLLCYLHRLWRAWLMRPVLATPTRAFVPDTLLSLANSALRIELLRLPPRLPQVLLLQLQLLW